MRIVPKAYLDFRDKFPILIRWILDIVVFIVVITIIGIIVPIILTAFR